jgi:hypothetical protein
MLHEMCCGSRARSPGCACAVQITRQVDASGMSCCSGGLGTSLSIRVMARLISICSMDGACSGRLVAEQDLSVCLCTGPCLAYFLKVETMIDHSLCNCGRSLIFQTPMHVLCVLYTLSRVMVLAIRISTPSHNNGHHLLFQVLQGRNE